MQLQNCDPELQKFHSLASTVTVLDVNASSSHWCFCTVVWLTEWSYTVALSVDWWFYSCLTYRVMLYSGFVSWLMVLLCFMTYWVMLYSGFVSWLMVLQLFDLSSDAIQWLCQLIDGFTVVWLIEWCYTVALSVDWWFCSVLWLNEWCYTVALSVDWWFYTVVWLTEWWSTLILHQLIDDFTLLFVLLSDAMQLFRQLIDGLTQLFDLLSDAIQWLCQLIGGFKLLD